MKEIILSAMLAGAVGSGGTYAVTRYREPPPVAVQDDGLERRKLDAADAAARATAEAAWLEAMRQMREQIIESTQVQRSIDDHVLQIACLIKGCKPQAMR